MTQNTFSFEPIRRALYGAELYRGFDLSDADSFANTVDFGIYREYVGHGKHAPRDPYVGMLRAMHDNSITHLTAQAIKNRKVVAVMGGHKLARGSDAYVQVAQLAAELAKDEYLVISGGGPGAMEAAHLGASFGLRPASDLDAAITTLTEVPQLPDLTDVVKDDGSIVHPIARSAHAWLAPALTVQEQLGADSVQSLAMPTWHYGFEPSTPLATHIAKLFQNSIREDGLLAVATQGIVFAQGRAGTVQEIFQDAAQNYYRSFEKRSSPMVLLGVKYWKETLPVEPVLRSLFGDRFAEIVLITDDNAEALRFLKEAKSQPSSLEAMLG
jgi:predicted Rossmann-fold nucleotide-binding protein